MIISEQNDPAFYEALWGPMLWGTLSDSTTLTYYNFSYVFDVFVNSQYVGRFFQEPNPQGVGYLDVAPLVRNYINLCDTVNHEVASATYGIGTPYVNTFNTGNGNSFIVTPIHGYETQVVVQVNVGEQYTVFTDAAGGTPYVTPVTSSSPAGTLSTALQIFDGLGNSSANWVGVVEGTAYETYVQYFQSTATDTYDGLVRGVPAAFNWDEAFTQQVTDKSLVGSSFGPFLMPGSTAYGYTPLRYPWSTATVADTLAGQFLSEDQLDRTVYQGDHSTVQWINVAPQMGTPDANLRFITPGFVRVVFNYTSGSSYARFGNWLYTGPADGAANQTSNVVVDNGTFYTTDTDGVLSSTNPISYIQSFACGPADLAPYATNPISTCTDYYVELWSMAGPTAPGTTSGTGPFSVPAYTITDDTSSRIYNYVISQQLHYHLLQQPAWDYPPIRFSWVNKYGGRDYFTFTDYFEVNTESDISDTYWKDPNYFAGTIWTIAPWRAGTQVVNKPLKRSLKVTSPYLPTAQITFLKSLFDSVQVHCWVPWVTEYPLPCVVTLTDFTEKKQINMNDRVRSLEFTADFSIPSRTQTN